MPTTRSRRGLAAKSTQTPRRDGTCAPPGMQRTGGPQGKKSMTMANKTFEYPPANGEVLVFMRYRKEMDRRMRNCIIRMKGRIRQPGTEGHCLGVADRVHVLECAANSDWGTRSDWCLALFMFPSEEKARRWYFSEPELRQPDFLPPSDSVQLFAMSLRYLPQPGKMTFNWMELHNVRSRAFLQQEYVDKAAEALDDDQVNHGVIFVQDPGSPSQLYRLKEAWIPHNADAYCVVNVYDSEDQFRIVYEKKNYSELQAKRSEVCDTVSLLFTVDPDVTGPPCHTSPRA
ncbi:uncharacterized protein [Littorina saxatilis]|uniref:Uncharacterized protein n=1 Tax=Littorina saxatilis TaxID=31220 RepID=A0AAN9GNT6_9CAEN